MKKSILIVMFLMVAMVSARPRLNVDIFDVTPTRVQPGQDVSVEISIRNLGTDTANDVTATIKSTDAFELKPQSDKSVSLSTLMIRDTFRVDYDLIASSTLKSGIYEIEVEVCESRSCITKKIPISVRGTPRWGISESVIGEVKSGESLDVLLQLENFGSGTSSNVRVEIVGSEENILVPIGRTTRFFEQISAGESVELDLGLFVGTPQRSGAYAIELVVSFDDESGSRSEEVIHYWVGVEASGVSTIKMTDFEFPENIEPGDSIEALVTIKNMDASSIRNVIMTAPDTEIFTPIGLAKTYVGDMGAGEEREVSFTIGIDGRTEPDTHLLHLAFDYMNAQREVQDTVTETIGLKIVSEPSISLTLRESRPPVLIPGETSIATLEMANTGAASVYYLVIEPADGHWVSPQSVYIGNLNPDDYDSVDFRITPPDDAKMQDTFPLRLSYRDGYNNPIVEIREVELATVSKAEGREYIDSGIGLGTLLLLAILVSGAAWYVKKRKKKDD